MELKKYFNAAREDELIVVLPAEYFGWATADEALRHAGAVTPVLAEMRERLLDAMPKARHVNVSVGPWLSMPYIVFVHNGAVDARRDYERVCDTIDAVWCESRGRHAR